LLFRELVCVQFQRDFVHRTPMVSVPQKYVCWKTELNTGRWSCPCAKVIRHYITCWMHGFRFSWRRHSWSWAGGFTPLLYRILVGKPEGKRPLGRPRLRWVDNLRMDLGEVGWGDVDWICLAKDRNRRRALVNSVMNLRVPWNAGKLSSGLTSSGRLNSARLCSVVYCVYCLLPCSEELSIGPYSQPDQSLPYLLVLCL
jgi:hypothetical protein